MYVSVVQQEYFFYSFVLSGKKRMLNVKKGMLPDVFEQIDEKLIHRYRCLTYLLRSEWFGHMRQVPLSLQILRILRK